MRKMMLLFAAATIMFSCKKSLSPDGNQEQAGTLTNVSNLKVNGIVASNDSAFNIVQYAGSNAATAGSTNGTSGDPTTAQFNSPEGIVFDSSGNMFVADRDNHVIRKITTAGVVSVFAGSVGVSGAANGTGSVARFSSPIRLAIDGSDNLYVADRDNARIRKITPAAVVSTIAGSTAGSGTTQFDWPIDVAVTSDGTKLYVADSHNNRIQKITYSGGTYTTTTYAGQLTAGYAGGVGTAAKFNSPSGVAIDAAGSVIVADRYNNCIRKITTALNVYRVAGVAGTSYDVDAPNGVATFGEPYGVTVANDGCIYVADITYHNIRRISNHGLFVHTVAGSGGVGNAIGNYSSFNVPTSVAIDNSGNFYVADASNNNIRKLVPETRVLQITHGWTQSTPYTGVTWYKYHGNRFYSPSQSTNKTQNVNVFDIDLSVNHLNFLYRDDTHRATVTDMVGTASTIIAALSGTFTTTRSGNHASFLRINDVDYWTSAISNTDNYWHYHEGMFFINSDGTIGMEQSNMSQTPFNPTRRQYMMSGAPVLVYNSLPVELSNPTADWGTPPQNLRDEIAARSALAIPIINNHVLLINTDGLETGKPCYYSPAPTYFGLTTADLSQFIQQFFHAKSAINLDGGGTSTMCLKGYGDNGGISGGIGVVNFPAYDYSTPAPPSNTAYGQQRTMGCAVAVLPN